MRSWIAYLQERLGKSETFSSRPLERVLTTFQECLLRIHLELLDHLEEKVNNTNLKILNRLQKRAKDLAIVMSVPGIGFTSASIILAEIGDYRDFRSCVQVAEKC